MENKANVLISKSMSSAVLKPMRVINTLRTHKGGNR